LYLFTFSNNLYYQRLILDKKQASIQLFFRKLLNRLRNEAMKGYTQKIDEALSAIIDSSGIWAYPNLAYAIYEYSEELSAARGDLIYFQPPDNYETPAAYKLTPKQWLEIYGELPPED
jgi:hypothetical protein